MREGCKSARDAMECLKRMDKVMKRNATKRVDHPASNEKKEYPKASEKKASSPKKENEEKSDEEIDAMLDALFLDLEKKKRKD